jgi:hypothetical protein
MVLSSEQNPLLVTPDRQSHAVRQYYMSYLRSVHSLVFPVLSRSSYAMKVFDTQRNHRHLRDVAKYPTIQNLLLQSRHNLLSLRILKYHYASPDVGAICASAHVWAPFAGSLGTLGTRPWRHLASAVISINDRQGVCLLHQIQLNFLTSHSFQSSCLASRTNMI